MLTKLASQVAGVAAETLGAAHGVAGLGKPTETLAEELMQVQDEQTESLRRIESGVQRLLDAPWNAAKVHLAECALPGRSPAQVHASLSKASDLLRDALGRVSPRSLGAAHVALDLALVLTLIRDVEGAKYYARMSSRSATDYLLDLKQKSRMQLNLGATRHLPEAAAEWYWIANAVRSIDAWPSDQLARIESASSEAYSALGLVAARAWDRGDVHDGWVPPGYDLHWGEVEE